MSVIRAGIPATLPQTGANHPNTAIRAAQTAFFRAALGEVQAPRAATLETLRTPTRAEPTHDAERYARPGSLLDIRI